MVLSDENFCDFGWCVIERERDVCVCCSRIQHVDRSRLVSAVEDEGQNVSRRALLLGVDMVRAMGMAYGHPEAA